jgi:hypothetical protein
VVSDSVVLRLVMSKTLMPACGVKVSRTVGSADAVRMLASRDKAMILWGLMKIFII